jgi:C4-type Zn-finger protein
MMNRIRIKGIVIMIPQNMLTCQRIVKSLSTFCKLFNVLMSRMTTHRIVITIPYFIFIIIFYYYCMYCSDHAQNMFFPQIML